MGVFFYLLIGIILAEILVHTEPTQDDYPPPGAITIVALLWPLCVAYVVIKFIATGGR